MVDSWLANAGEVVAQTGYNDINILGFDLMPQNKEALKRGTSVYLVDRVIPMLPHQLSNGICSLNQGCDRLALSCIMKVDPSGKVVDHQIAETLINVDHRMTYTSVAKILRRRYGRT